MTLLLGPHFLQVYSLQLSSHPSEVSHPKIFPLLRKSSQIRYLYGLPCLGVSLRMGGDFVLMSNCSLNSLPCREISFSLTRFAFLDSSDSVAISVVVTTSAWRENVLSPCHHLSFPDGDRSSSAFPRAEHSQNTYHLFLLGLSRERLERSPCCHCLPNPWSS